jgi:4-amino-4-deoxy-L-arabinose transferase-like glycosyltransferase
VGLWLTLTFLFFLRSLDENPPSRWICWGFAAACALNVLTKGLIGLVFPAGVIGLYLILTRNLRHLLRMRLVSSTAVFLLIAAPWHILAAIRNPDQGSVRGFLWFYFVNEHFLRYLNKRVPRDYDTVPFAVFWGLLLVWLLPWVAFLPQALKQIPARWSKFRAGLDSRQCANLLFFLWAAVILIFFSFSTRQEYYTIPALPGLALLVGGWLSREEESAPLSTERRSGRISSGVLFGVGLLVFVVGMLFLLESKTPPPGTDLAELLKKNPQDYAMSFGHFLDLTPQAMGAFRVPLLGFSLAFVLGTGLNWVYRRKGDPAYGNAALALMMVVVLASVHAAFVTFSPILSSEKLAVALQKIYQPQDIVVIDGLYENASSINFYTGIPMRSLHQPTGNLWYGAQFPDASRVMGVCFCGPIGRIQRNCMEC